MRRGKHIEQKTARKNKQNNGCRGKNLCKLLQQPSFVFINVQILKFAHNRLLNPHNRIYKTILLFIFGFYKRYEEKRGFI